MKPLVADGWDFDYLEKYLEGKVPILTINMTGKCNYACPYCSTNAGVKDKYELNAAEWIDIIKDSHALGTEVIWIAGKGEPLLDSAFKEVVEYANSLNMTTILNTNASLIDQEMATFLYDNHVVPEIKMVSLNEKIYDELSGKKNTYDNFINGVDNLLDAGYGQIIRETEDARITNCSGLVLLAKPALESLPEVFQYCKEQNIAPTVSDVVATGRIIQLQNLNDFILSDEENRRLNKKASEIMEYPFESGLQECYINLGLFVLNNGDLVVNQYGMSCDICCPKSKVVIGNLKEMTVADGWKKIKDMRAQNEVQIIKKYQTESNPSDSNQDGSFGSCVTSDDTQNRYFEVFL